MFENVELSVFHKSTQRCSLKFGNRSASIEASSGGDILLLVHVLLGRDHRACAPLLISVVLEHGGRWFEGRMLGRFV